MNHINEPAERAVIAALMRNPDPALIIKLGITPELFAQDATREAFKQGLIEHGETWVDMIAARNKSSHTYNKKTANEVADAIASSFVQEFAAFQAKFAALAQQESS